MFKALLKFLFVIVPFFILGGLELVFLHKREIYLYAYETKPQPKKKSKKDLRREAINSFLKDCYKQKGSN